MIAIVIAVLLAAAPPDLVVARVDRATITASQLVARLGSVTVNGVSLAPSQLLEIVIDETLLTADGYRQGLAKEPSVIGAVDSSRSRLLAELYTERELNAASKVDDAQARQFFHDSRDVAQLKLIIVATREAAQELMKRLEKGADFAAEARNSLNPDQAKRGGDAGSVTRGSLEVALREAVFKEPVGKLVGPLQLSLGWAVLRVDGRTIATDAEYEPRREEFRQFAEKQLQSATRGHIVSKLRAQGNIVLDEAFIRSTAARFTATAEEEQHIIATVHGRALRYSEVLEELRRVFGSSPGTHGTGATVKLEIAWRRVDELVLANSGTKAGLDKDPAVVSVLAQVERKAVLSAAADRIRAAAGPPDALEVGMYYQEHSADFLRPRFRDCSHLVVSDADFARTLRKRVLGEGFEALATEYSRDRDTASKGGRLGELTEAQIEAISTGGEPAFAVALTSTPPGQVSEPVKTKAGWHLVRCGPAIAEGPIPLAQVQDAIKKRMQAERADQAVRARIADLRGRANISVDGAALAKVRPQ